jgi:hypothetical protein
VITSLDDLELAEREHGGPGAIGWHLQQVLEEGDAPADQRREVPGPVAQVLQVRIPRERHEDVGAAEQEDEPGDGRHGVQEE